MRPLLQHASRAFSAHAAHVTPIARPATVRSFASRASSRPSLCVACPFRVETAPRWGQSPLGVSALLRRGFRQPPNDEGKPPPETTPEQNAADIPLGEPAPPAPPEPPKKTKTVDTISRVPAEQLPSHREAQQWSYLKQLNKLMDDLLPKLADMTQRVNTFTGTDYSGIEALKREIKEQEQLVKARRAAIEEARQALDAALSQQASSQKEVVALLERKHSWSAADLERYMSLIRSEHVNDQAVREAKDAINTAENALEEARAQLEKRERSQYHEEQIWSDTIRRNSTWVTFGLMGVNIFLLLASLLIFEPYRRRKIVREVKAALEAQKLALEPVAAKDAGIEAETEAEIGKDFEPYKLDKPEDSAFSPEDTTVEEPSVDVSAVPGKIEVLVDETTQTAETDPEPIAETPPPETIPLTPEGVAAQEAINIEEEIKSDTTPQAWQDKVTLIAKDIVSDRVISMRRIDFTSAVISSAAAGAIITAAIVGLLRPR
ncbi:hypothetical protein P280DRAFT_442306 [Massarina eburnea CBS 473.64]|uniref:Sensitive to high expression protein 9, mitochondrial n=1 Tax=Massarina eburnea CBS 473.64 TaxID=1395130 RepID=A0A6A6SDJ8_9PLEO|nr:hypothetical protein P280DRAFT_442306 [Massarina eburnea CBS 473.64]